LSSGVSESTTSIFLESAYFNPVFIRKTSKNHGLKTDASFRFERGADPEITIFALKRAALLIKEIAGGKISSEVKDVYPNPVKPFAMELWFDHVDNLIGKRIERNVMKQIIEDLEIRIDGETEQGLQLSVPPFKVDVQREADVIEEILRVYGYNNIEFEEAVRYSMVRTPKPDFDKLRNIAAGQLTGQGFSEIMCNSLTKSAYERLSSEFKPENSVRILNPLSKDLEIMRPGLLFGGLETIQYNQNRKNADLKLFEFGSVYRMNVNTSSPLDGLSKYFEEEHLALFATGREQVESWKGVSTNVDFYTIKSVIYKLVEKLGVAVWKLNLVDVSTDIYTNAYQLHSNGNVLAEFGQVSTGVLKHFDIKSDVFFGFIRWKDLMDMVKVHATQYQLLPKFPEVRRDLALLVDKSVKFVEIEQVAYESEKQILQRVGIFDIYEGDKIPAGLKSYAVSFVLSDSNKTLTDEEIDRTMKKLILAFQQKLNATLR
jgi:phenylalanyl-tRNA synthetase beta chain